MDSDPFKDLKGSAVIEAQIERERQAFRATGSELRARLEPAALAQSALDTAIEVGDRALRTPLADWAALAMDASESRVLRAALSGVGRLRGRARAAKAPPTMAPTVAPTAAPTVAAFVAENTGKAGEAKRAAKLRAAAEKRAAELAAGWTALTDEAVAQVRADLATLDRAHREVEEPDTDADTDPERRHEVNRAALLSRFAAGVRADLDRDLADLPGDLRSAEVDRREAYYRHQLAQLAQGKGLVARLIDDHPLVLTAAAAAIGVALAAVLIPSGGSDEA